MSVFKRTIPGKSPAQRIAAERWQTFEKKLKIGRMEKIWVIAIAIIVFLAINFIFYKAMNGYYKREFGKKMWKLRGNKVYFWQGSIFVSTAGTFLVMYFLKYLNILTF